MITTYGLVEISFSEIFKSILPLSMSIRKKLGFVGNKNFINYVQYEKTSKESVLYTSGQQFLYTTVSNGQQSALSRMPRSDGCHV